MSERRRSTACADWGAETAIVLGSGLNSLVANAAADQRDFVSRISRACRARRARPHAVEFVLGVVGETRVIYAQGRVHLYEGHSAQRVTAGIRRSPQRGIKRMILNECRGQCESGFCSRIMDDDPIDHLNLTGTTPLLGSRGIYRHDGCLFARFGEIASAPRRENDAGSLHEGVYAGLLGPQYETPAEVRMLRALGADAIGMSTVLEAIQARALGLEVAGFSCLTNWAGRYGLTTNLSPRRIVSGKHRTGLRTEDFCPLDLARRVLTARRLDYLRSVGAARAARDLSSSPCLAEVTKGPPSMRRGRR